MATHFSVHAWRIPGTGEPGGLPSMGSHRVGHDWSDLAAAAADRESACNAGNPSSIAGSERSPGEGISYPLQYSWVSLVAQMVKNPPAMKETWVRPLDWEDPLEEGMATHSSTVAWRISMDRGAWQAIVHGVARSRTRLSDWAYQSTGGPYIRVVDLTSYRALLSLFLGSP